MEPEFIIICSLLILLTVVIILFLRKSNAETAKQNEYIPKDSTSDRKARKTRTSKTKEYNGIVLDISMIPSSVDLDENLLPYAVNREGNGYGRRFNAFIFDGDLTHYHKSKCTIIKGNKKTLLHRYVAIQNYKSCEKCSPKDNIDDWYIKFLEKNFVTDNEINKIKSQFALETAKLSGTQLNISGRVSPNE